METATSKPFYNLDQIKSIPILEVCERFGVEVKQYGKNLKCKIRDERTPSTVLHPESNTFYDFGGNHDHGDSISFVGALCGVDRGEAITMIANAFHIEPQNPRAGLNPNELTLFEYNQIGLEGDLATKNFDFDIGRQGVERVKELSEKYNMSMNALKEISPRIFERLLRQRAIPFVRDLRNDYYKHVFDLYTFCSQANMTHVFFSRAESGAGFEDEIRALQNAERTLERACKGTSIEAYPVKDYNPGKDIAKLLSGEVKFPLGTVSYMQMKSLSEESKSPVKYQTCDLKGYLRTDLRRFNYSAFMKNGNVVVGFLEKDRGDIKPELDKIKAPSKGGLDGKIATAKQQQAEQEGGRKPYINQNYQTTKTQTGEGR